jgi:hypothetical protein
MTELPAVRCVVNKVFAELGTIDVIVSNAGYGLFGAAEELSDEQVAHQLATNLFGPIQLIRAALIEPGGARTNFRFGGAQLGTQLEAYKGTPAAIVHTMIKDTSRLPPGDPAKMAKVIIDSVDQDPAPKRIALGSDAYGVIHKALTDRLSALEAQREIALSTDFPKEEQRVKQPA